MTTTPTSNAIPSEAPQDLKFNAGKIDEEVNSDLDYYTDRFGVNRLTNTGRNHQAATAISSFGYITLDSFQVGATITLPNQVLRDTSTGEYFRWDGGFGVDGKVVPAGSTPETAGGVGAGKWLSVGSAVLSSSQDGAGDALVAVKQPYAGAVVLTQHEKNAQSISVKDFGAKGDTATDDTEALRAAALAAYTQGAMLEIPDGSYLISGDVDFKRQLLITGAVTIMAPDIGDAAPTIKINISRRMVLEGITFLNLLVIVAPTDSNIYLPTTVRRSNFYKSNLTIGQDKVITMGYTVENNKFSSGTSRSINAVQIKNCNHVTVENNEIQEYARGVVVNPTLSFAAHEITIRKNRISHCVFDGISLRGTSMYRLAKISIEGNVINGARRDESLLTRAAIMALFCFNLRVRDNTISHLSNCLTMNGVLDAQVHGNDFMSLSVGSGITGSGCSEVMVYDNVFSRYLELGYSVLVDSASLQPQVTGNLYSSAQWRVFNNKFNCINQGVKFGNTDSVDVWANEFTANQSIGSLGLLWFAAGVTRATYYDNKFYAPSGTPVRNDVGSNVSSSASNQSLVVTTVPSLSVTALVITASDVVLNGAKSYLVAFTAGEAKQIKQLADSSSPKKLSEWMALASSPVLGWNSSPWNVATGNLGDIIVNGGTQDAYGLEDFWTARAMMVIDRKNKFSCRNFFTTARADSTPLMISAASVAEQAWQTCSFRPPLIVDGLIFNPVAAGMMTTQGYSSDIAGRCCLGQKADGSYVLLVVDGSTGASGCTISQLAAKMLAAGCYNAFNLDGGGSTTLWYNGAVINSPSDAGGERAIPAVMYV